MSLVATTLARLLDAGLERPPALRCALTGGGPVPAALLAARAEAGVPVSLTYGLTEACSQVTTTPAGARSAAGGRDAADRRPAAVLHARADRAATARSCVARADRRAGRARRTTAGCTPATSARSTSTAGCA